MCGGLSSRSSPSSFSTFWKSNLETNDDEVRIVVGEEGLVEDAAEIPASLLLLVCLAARPRALEQGHTAL